MTGALDALARPVPVRRGLVLAVIALALTTIGGWGPSALLTLGAIDPVDQAAVVPIYLGGSALALLGFIPLLLAGIALVGRGARPPWVLGVALLLLLVRPVILALEALVSPLTIVPPELALPLFLTTSIAAGLAAVSVLPTSGPARRPERIAVVGLGVAALVGLTLFAYTGLVVPVAAIALVIALALRLRRDSTEADLEALDPVDDAPDLDDPAAR